MFLFVSLVVCLSVVSICCFPAYNLYCYFNVLIVIYNAVLMCMNKLSLQISSPSSNPQCRDRDLSQEC